MEYSGAKSGIVKLKGGENNQYFVQTFYDLKNNIYYLGEWHLHPGSSPTPSVTDISQMKKIEHNPKFNCKEPILLILGEKYNDSKVNLILFKDNKQYFYIETE